MPTHRPPQDFVTRLQTYDAHLSVRWSDRAGAWRIERKFRPAQHDLDPGLFADQDDYETARAGRCLIMRVPPEMLDNRVFDTLWAGDVQRRGGGKAVADEADNAYDERLEKAIDKWGDEIEQAARERVRYMNTVRTLSEAQVHTAPPGGLSIND